MKITAIVEALVASGATPETILAVVRATEAQMVDALEMRRASDRERQARKRHANVMSRDVTVSHAVSRSRARVEDSSSSTEDTGQKKIIVTPRHELEAVLSPERAVAVIDHRQKIRKPLTDHAARLLASKFAKCADPNAAADAMIANGWQGFEPEWMENRAGNRGPPVNGHALKSPPPAQAAVDVLERLKTNPKPPGNPDFGTGRAVETSDYRRTG